MEEIRAWFNSGWQPQAQLGDGKAPRAVQPSPSPGDEDATLYAGTNNVTRNQTYLNHAEIRRLRLPI